MKQSRGTIENIRQNCNGSYKIALSFSDCLPRCKWMKGEEICLVERN